MRERIVLEAVDAIYGAVDGRFDYQQATEAVSRATDDTGIALFQVGASRFDTLASRNIPEGAMKAMSGGDWNADSHSLIRSIPLMRERVPVLRRMLVSDEDFYGSLQYEMTVRPWGFHSDGATIIERKDESVMLYGFVRHSGQQEINQDILSRMALLSTHMWRVVGFGSIG